MVSIRCSPGFKFTIIGCIKHTMWSSLRCQSVGIAYLIGNIRKKNLWITHFITRLVSKIKAFPYLFSGVLTSGLLLGQPGLLGSQLEPSRNVLASRSHGHNSSEGTR